MRVSVVLRKQALKQADNIFLLPLNYLGSRRQSNILDDQLLAGPQLSRPRV